MMVVFVLRCLEVLPTTGEDETGRFYVLELLERWGQLHKGRVVAHLLTSPRRLW